MAPCGKKCWFCPLKKFIQGTDRGLRATYFAAICLKAAVPGRHPNLDCMINCVGIARDVNELLNCGEDLHDLWWRTVFTSTREAPVATRLDQGACGLSLLSSFITIGSVFHDYDLIGLGKYGEIAGDAARAVSFTGHACALGSLMTAKSSGDNALTEAVTSISEGAYMALEFLIDRTSIPVQGAIGISTAAWGLYEITPPNILRSLVSAKKRFCASL